MVKKHIKLKKEDEILRFPHGKLIVNIRGNKSLLLVKMIYTEHPLSKKLKYVSNNEEKLEKITFDNF